MDVSFVLRNRNSLRRLSFNDIPMRCENGRRYRTGGRRFIEPIPLNNQNEFRARASGDISNGSHEQARVRGKVRPRRGKARGVIRVTATFDSGLRCHSGRQPFRARRL